MGALSLAGRTKREKSRTKQGLGPTKPAAWGAELGGTSSLTARTIRFGDHITLVHTAARHCPMTHLPRLITVPHCNTALFMSRAGCFLLFLHTFVFVQYHADTLPPRSMRWPPTPPDLLYLSTPVSAVFLLPRIGVSNSQKSLPRVDSFFSTLRFLTTPHVTQEHFPTRCLVDAHMKTARG